MKNTSFMYKTEAEKTNKLITLLRQRSRDTLSNEHLHQLTLAVKTGRQYTVRIHTVPSSFCESLVLVKSDTDNDIGTVVFGQALFGEATETRYQLGRLFMPSRQACVIVSRKRADKGGRFSFSNEIHLYIPSSLYEKGNHPKYGQEQKATHGV